MVDNAAIGVESSLQNYGNAQSTPTVEIILRSFGRSERWRLFSFAVVLVDVVLAPILQVQLDMDFLMSHILNDGEKRKIYSTPKIDTTYFHGLEQSLAKHTPPFTHHCFFQ